MIRRPSTIDLKIVVLGSASVGKTSIINRYCSGVFQEDTLTTIGASFFTHTVHVDTTEVTLMVWDTAGEERFRSVAPSLLRGANGLVLVYDLNHPESFQDIDLYMGMFLDEVNVNPSAVMPVLLLGNKCDLETNTFDDKIASLWAEKNRVKFSYKVSAKTGENISEAFLDLVTCLVTPASFQEQNHLSFPTYANSESPSTCKC